MSDQTQELSSEFMEEIRPADRGVLSDQGPEIEQPDEEKDDEGE